MMEGLFVNLVEQFQNLFDPSTALGAFLISLASGIVVSILGGFFSGRSYQKKIDKENSIEVQKAGEILQDIRKESTPNVGDEKIKKTNSIKAGTVTGAIKQDVEE